MNTVNEPELLYWRKVPLPTRMLADTLDGAIASSIWFSSAILVDALKGVLPDSVLRLGWFGLPIALLYVLFRDAIGNGTSIGKRLLGLRVMNLRTGVESRPNHGWPRDLLDPIPVFNFVDFLGACVDPAGQKFMDKRLKTQLTYREK